MDNENRSSSKKKDYEYLCIFIGIPIMVIGFIMLSPALDSLGNPKTYVIDLNSPEYDPEAFIILGGFILTFFISLPLLSFCFVQIDKTNLDNNKKLPSNIKLEKTKIKKNREIKILFCRYCGTKRSDNVEICNYCGVILIDTSIKQDQDLKEDYCRRCGYNLYDNLYLCTHCGEKIKL